MYSSPQNPFDTRTRKGSKSSQSDLSECREYLLCIDREQYQAPPKQFYFHNKSKGLTNMKLLNSIFLLLALVKISKAAFCGCDSCTNEVWDSFATDSEGTYTCGGRISWLQTTLGYDEVSACAKVSDEFPGGPCGPVCDPRRCNPPTLKPS